VEARRLGLTSSAAPTSPSPSARTTEPSFSGTRSGTSWPGTLPLLGFDGLGTALP
jgi:hypothetical protein